MVCDWSNCYFSFWAIFCLFTPSPQRPKKWKFQNNGKTSGYIIILNRCTEKHGHIFNCSWHIMHDGCSCYFSFWAIFCSPPLPPHPTPTQNSLKNESLKKKMKAEKKNENAWRYHSTQVYQKSWSYAVLYLRYGAWHKIIFHFGLFFALLHP